MKHLFPFILFYFSVLLPGMAQSQYLSSKDSDPEALSLLTKAGQSFASKNAQVNFKLKVTYPGNEPVTSDGILYQAGKSYNLQLKEYAIISDGTTRWVYLKTRNEVNMYNNPMADWISPQDCLQLHKSQIFFYFSGTRADGRNGLLKQNFKRPFEDYTKFSIGT